MLGGQQLVAGRAAVSEKEINMTSITMKPMNECPIWPDFRATIHPQLKEHTLIVESARAGGKYEISLLAKDLVEELDLRARARLTTWLVDQRGLGSQCPKITCKIVEYATVKRSLQPYERAMRLLRFMAERAETIATKIYIDQDGGDAYAWSESTKWDELNVLITYLRNERLVAVSYGTTRFECMISVDGHRKIAEQEAHIATTQAFVAMWFHDDMNDAFENGIKPAIEAAGYKPLRIDRKPDVNKIDDEIIAEIRRSRFLVADFTHGAEGARGGVYFEAGFAEGLGIPVIYTCRKDMMDKLHFDTRQYFHIDWETPDELRDRLLHRIRALIGEGPGANVAV